MNIALDYDDTYTRDPVLWNDFIVKASSRGHMVYIVTMRYEGHEADDVSRQLRGYPVFIKPTGRKAKRSFMYEQGIDIHIWIDDTPDFILHDAAS